MTRQRALALAGGLLWWAAAAGAAVGQALPAQPARYLLTTEASDGRALWVNPAGLARAPEASIGADVTVDRFFPGPRPQLSEYGASLTARGLAAGWEHERLPGRQYTNVFAVGLGMGDESFSGGVTRRWYTGSVTGSAWDAALRLSTWGGTQLSLVTANLGSPRLADSTYWATLVPGASVNLFGGALQAAGEWEVAPHAWRSIAYRAGGTLALGRGFALLVRADLSPSFKRRGLVVALGFDASGSRAGAFALASGGASEVDALGLSGAIVTRGPARR